MHEMSLPEKYRDRIGEISPELAVKSVKINDDGLMNDIVIVNGEFVYRFPKNDYAFRNLPQEARLLNFLRDKVTLEIPKPFYLGDDAMAYRLIPGETLRRDRLLKLSEDEQQKAADQLGEFFKELHGVDTAEAGFEMPKANALAGYAGWLKAYERIREKVFPLLMPH